MNSAASTPSPSPETRRTFLKQTAVAATAAVGARYLNLAATTPGLAAPAIAAAIGATAAVPWYRRTARWMQTNIAELDITRYDIGWWREQWKRTNTQGIVVNAGGIVAFYPTKIPFHPLAQFLGDRDLFGDLVKAAQGDGIRVFARMDSNGAPNATYQAHPEWFTAGPNGRPFQDRELNIPCINGGYYREHIPAILSEIAQKYHPDGFTDNIWSGAGRDLICQCDNCAKQFRDQRGLELPRTADWNASNYRAWIEWSYGLRLEIWDLFNQTTRAAGGPDCIWSGMNSGGIGGDFRDLRAIAQRAEILMLDNQRRTDATGFQANGISGRLVHGLMGPDKLAPESMAMYQYGATNFRIASRPEPEARLWALEGFASGIQPWWHYINAYQEDRRMYDTPVPMGAWHLQNEEYLLHRKSVATVGILHSLRNHDFFGRANAAQMVAEPERGFTEALLQARIPYLMVDADDFEKVASQLKLVILPNLGTMTDTQVAAVRTFVQQGGGLIATGATSLCDQWGDPRADFALADIFGVHLPANHALRTEAGRRQVAGASQQTYLRLLPEMRAQVYGPHPAGEPAAAGTRHDILRGFEKTDIIPYGGTLEALEVDASAQVLLTFVPTRPNTPPEMIWTQNDHTNLPGLIVREARGAGRVVYLAADLDRRYARENTGDHGRLLGNLIRWATHDQIPLTVEGAGLVDTHLYQQPGRALLHLVNLTNANTWRSSVEELIPVGPLKVAVKLPEGMPGKNLRLLVSNQKPALMVANGWARFELSSVLDHELVVIE